MQTKSEDVEILIGETDDIRNLCLSIVSSDLNNSSY